MFVTVAVFAAGRGLPASALTPETETVDARVAVFDAGRTGTFAPTAHALTSGAAVISFPSVTGSVFCAYGCTANGPDGGGFTVDISSTQGISGVIDATAGQASLALMGVFLDDSVPADPAPARLNFTNNHDFTDLYPQLRQSFFIGDAVTVSGVTQAFHIPAGATRFYLGYADAYSFQGAPGYWGDNTGAFVVQFLMGPVAYQRTTTVVTSTSNPSWVDQGVTYTATVANTGGAGTPSGTVQFTVDGVAIGTAELDRAGHAYLNASPPIGTYAVTAAYVGDGSHAPSTSTTLTQRVVPRPTTTALSAAPNPASVGATVTLTATVARYGTATAPTGTVAFSDAAVSLGTATVAANGTATLTTNALTRGTHPIIAGYQGDTTFAASSSTVANVAVNSPGATSTTTSMTSSLNPSQVADPVTFTAAVTGATGTPTGPVLFREGATTIGSGTLDGSGQATLTTAMLSAGSHSVTADYQGDNTNAASSSSPLSQVVNSIDVTVTLSSTPNPSNGAAPVTFTATVTPTANPNPLTGTVTFTEGATLLGAGTVNSSGVATFVTSTLAPGGHPVVARYGGDATYGTGASSTVNQVVNGVATTTTITSSSNPSALDQTVSFTATMHASSGTAVPNGGSVTFSETGDVISTVDLDATGHATITVSGASIGVHPIVAAYSGDLFRTASASSPFQQFVLPSGSFGLSNPALSGPEHCSVCDPINSATGNFSETISDLAIPGRGPAIDFARSYNAQGVQTPTPGPLGWGWTHAYNATLTIDTVSNVATVHQANGATVAFTPTGNAYTGAANVTATLVHNTDGTFTFTLEDRRAERFAADGHLVSQTDRTGEITTLGYTAGRLSSVTDPAGRTLTVSYNAAGQLTSISDPAGRGVTYGYDPAWNLASVTDVAGKTTGYSYDSAHRLTVITQANLGTVTNVYDSADRVTDQYDALNRHTHLAYSAGSTTITDPRGDVTVLGFDAAGNNTSETRGYGTPQAATWVWTYNAADEQLTATDPNSHVTTKTWDGHGNPLASTDALQRTTTYTYDAFNDVQSITDPLQVTTTLSYDTAGNLVGTSRPLTATAQTATIALVRDPSHRGDVTEVHDQLGHITRLGYNAAGDLVSSIDPTGAKTTFAYDSVGRRVSMTSPRGNAASAPVGSYKTLYTTTAWGAVATVTDPAGGVTTTTYDAMRQPVTVKDPDLNVTTFGYDLAGQRTSETRPDHTVNATGYDAAGNLASQTDGLNRTTSYGYDPLDRLISVTDPDQRTMTATYDGAGNRLTVSDPMSRTKTYGYDAADQLNGIVYSDGLTPNVTFGYDADGQRTSMVDGAGTTTFAFDSLHRLTQSSLAAGATALVTTPSSTQTYGYDLAGRGTSIDDGTGVFDFTSGSTHIHVGGGIVTRGYDDAGRMTAVTDFLGRTATFGYDPDSNLTTVVYPNHTTSTRTYDPAGRVLSINDVGPDSTFLADTYTYDPAGRLKTAPVATTTGTGAQAYAYDPNQRLTTNNIPTAVGTPVPLRGYSYDAADNLSGITVGAVANTLTHDPANQLTSLTNTATGQGIAYTNDADGERTSATDFLGNSALYGWDAEQRITSYTGPLANAANTQASAALTKLGVNHAVNVHTSYQYTGDNLRADLTWDRSASMPLVIGDILNSVFYITGPDGLPIERIDVGGQAQSAIWYHADRQGSTRALTSDDGHLLSSYTYDPYGNPTITGTRIANPFGYTGQYTDLMSGLLYLRARWYDTHSSHFLSRDAISVLTRQPYGYAGGEPIGRADPLGLCDIGVSGAASALPPGDEGSGDRSRYIAAMAAAVSGAAAVNAILIAHIAQEGPLQALQSASSILLTTYVGLELAEAVAAPTLSEQAASLSFASIATATDLLVKYTASKKTDFKLQAAILAFVSFVATALAAIPSGRQP